MTDEAVEAKRLGSPWDDPNVPIGDAPPLPRWPLAVFSLAWVGWLAFLVVMAIG